MIRLDDPEERDAAAGEYVLGTLDAEEHGTVQAKLAEDPALRRAVYAWQDRLLGLSARASAVQPPPQLWQRIDLTLEAMAAAVPAGESASARSSGRRSAARVAPTPWWQRLGWWQGFSGVAVAAALLMAVLLSARLGPPEPAGARYLAVLQSPTDQSTGWIVELQAGRALRLVPVGATAPVPPGKALQFWTKAEGAAGPTSLGLVRAGQPLELPIAALPAAEARQLFEITLEPEAGSPIGRPTGPILYLGRTVAL